MYEPLTDVSSSDWSEDKKRLIWSIAMILFSTTSVLVFMFWPIGLLLSAVMYIGGKKKKSNLRYLVKNIFPDSVEKQHKALRNFWVAPLIVTAIVFVFFWACSI